MGKELVVYDETTWRPYCHVSDISRAIPRDRSARRYRVQAGVQCWGSHENNFTKKMIVDELVRLVPGGKVTYKMGGFDQRDYRVSFDKIRAALGFRAEYSVPSAIAKVVSCIALGFYYDVEDNKSFYGNYVVNTQSLKSPRSGRRSCG